MESLIGDTLDTWNQEFICLYITYQSNEKVILLPQQEHQTDFNFYSKEKII